jgi:hypothetical protein
MFLTLPFETLSFHVFLGPFLGGFLFLFFLAVRFSVLIPLFVAVALYNQSLKCRVYLASHFSYPHL